MVLIGATAIAAIIIGALAGTLSSRERSSSPRDSKPSLGDGSPSQDEFISQIDKQYETSVAGVFNNMGPSGSKAPGVPAGVMIASPSTQDPEYFYTWTRDSGLTMKMVVDEFLHGKTASRQLIKDFSNSQAILQNVTNLSGDLSSGKGLGEPKYFVNLTRWDGVWGRPQRDGPALRATALLTYVRWLLDTGKAEDASEAKDKIWPVIRNDLNYVAQYWNETGFDLWEETLGSSFFTTAAQHRALVEGAILGKRMNQQVSAYESQAPNILCFLQSFWNGRHIVANTNTDPGFKKNGIDANSVLASVISFDPVAQCDDSTFQPCSPRALANLKVYIDSFRDLYPINNGIAANAAVATGRYIEDVYFGGHPWYLTTLAVAEQLYNAVQQWNKISKVTVTELDIAFWKDVYSNAKVGSYQKDNEEFKKLVDGVLNFADGFVKIALKYTPSSGALSEQFSRQNGSQVSARDLTWSYAAFITARAARLAAISDHPQVPSWGGDKANSIPPVCKRDSVLGIYEPAPVTQTSRFRLRGTAWN